MIKVVLFQEKRRACQAYDAELAALKNDYIRKLKPGAIAPGYLSEGTSSSVGPGMSSLDPGMSSVGPGRSSVAPGMSSVCPGMSSVGPGMSSLGPGYSHPGESGRAPGRYRTSAKSRTSSVDSRVLGSDICSPVSAGKVDSYYSNVPVSNQHSSPGIAGTSLGGSSHKFSQFSPQVNGSPAMNVHQRSNRSNSSELCQDFSTIGFEQLNDVGEGVKSGEGRSQCGVPGNAGFVEVSSLAGRSGQTSGLSSHISSSSQNIESPGNIVPQPAASLATAGSQNIESPGNIVPQPAASLATAGSQNIESPGNIVPQPAASLATAGPESLMSPPYQDVTSTSGDLMECPSQKSGHSPHQASSPDRQAAQQTFLIPSRPPDTHNTNGTSLHWIRAFMSDQSVFDNLLDHVAL